MAPGDRSGDGAPTRAGPDGRAGTGPLAPLRPSVQDACERWGPRPAISAGDTTLTYGEVWARVQRLAATYRRWGIGRGDRILCQFRNCPDHVVAVAAAWHVGAIHVGADNDLTGPELARLAQRLDAAALLFQAPSRMADPFRPLEAVRAASQQTRVLVHAPGPGGDMSLEDLPEPDGEVPAQDPEPLRDALVFLTSGTTGEPKAVVESLAAHWAKMQFFADGFAPGTGDTHLLFLPMSHVFGLRLALLALLRGGRLVLLERFSPGRVLDVVGREEVTVMPAVPAHLRLLRDRHDPRRHDTASLRWVLSAASGLPRPLAEWVYGTLGARILFVYGCSEGFTTQTAERDAILAGSVGNQVFRGPPGTPADGTVRVVDPRDRTPQPAGQAGEIEFGAAVPVRYWDRAPVATDGWYRTGDLGFLDEVGRVHITGRLKELINRGGLHVSSDEVEMALLRHAEVADAAVIASPDPVLGEAVCACVVPAGGDPPGLADLHDFLSRRLARHKLPDELCIVESIPRTVIGKVDREALADRVLDGGVARERLRR